MSRSDIRQLALDTVESHFPALSGSVSKSRRPDNRTVASPRCNVYLIGEEPDSISLSTSLMESSLILEFHEDGATDDELDAYGSIIPVLRETLSVQGYACGYNGSEYVDGEDTVTFEFQVKYEV